MGDYDEDSEATPCSEDVTTYAEDATLEEIPTAGGGVEDEDLCDEGDTVGGGGVTIKAAPLGIAEQLQQLEDQHNKAIKRRHRSFWKKPPTFVYADNFGFGVNGYQPMIDYLDTKDSGGVVNKDDVHLPLLEERCMRKYHARKPFSWYENRDIDTYIDKGEKIRTQIRQNDAVGISNVLRRTHTNWSMTRKWVQLVKNSAVVDYRKLHNKATEFGDINLLQHHLRTRPSSPAVPPIHATASVDYYRALSPKLPPPHAMLLPSPPPPLLLPPAPQLEVPRPLLLPPPPPPYLDPLTEECASVVKALARSRMDHENVMVARREKLSALDNQFEDAIGHIYQQMRRITERANMYSSAGKDPREIEINEQDLALRNRIRRADELQNMMDCVNDLTEMDSARNTLRTSLRHLDNDMRGLSERVDDMRHLQARESTRNVDDMYRNVDLDIMKAVVDARRSASRSRSMAREEEDDYEPYQSCRRPKQAILFPTRERVTPRPRESLMPSEMISDVYARVLKKAGEMSTAGEINVRTSEQRRINSRARFINVLKPRPDTADEELLVPPTKTEMNIDYMSKTLAARGSCQRRFEIDQEVDNPHSHLMTNAYKDYCELRIRKPIEVHPSLSNRVRCANIRARARSSLMGC